MSTKSRRTTSSLSETSRDGTDVDAECIDARTVRLAPGAERDVERRSLAQRGQELAPHELAEPALEPVPVDCRMVMSRHDQADAWICERGSCYPDVEMGCPDSLPLANDVRNVRAPRQPILSRESERRLTRRRTCSAAER